MKILIALDDSDASHDAVDFANEMLGLDAEGAARHEVLILHVTRSVLPFAYVADPLTGGIVYPEALPLVMEAQAAEDESEEAAMHDVAAELEGAPEVLIEHGDAGRTICAVAEDSKVDLIIVGTRDRGAWSKLWHPSVSDHVVRHAVCPVLVVR
jgi:nucleotide-binding universal stress UspA family protein